MTSSTPYLIRGLYDWILDNSMTPYLLADTTSSSVKVPVMLTKDDKIVLNIAPKAVSNLVISNSAIEFLAMFSGQEHSVYVPVSSVIAIYSKENGSGMTFDVSPEDSDTSSDTHIEKSPSSFPNLRIVK